jgi:hypothetical protein
MTLPGGNDASGVEEIRKANTEILDFVQNDATWVENDAYDVGNDAFGVENDASEIASWF